MNLTAVRARIMRAESLRLKPYDDATGQTLKSGDTLVGQITIGYGYNLSEFGISSAQAADWREDKIAGAVHDVGTFPWFAALDDVRQGVVIEMAYNMGLPRLLGFTRFLSDMAFGHYDQAADEMLDSKWANEVKGRAVTLAAMMRTGKEQTV